MEGPGAHPSVECATVCVAEPGPNVAEAETAESVTTADIQAQDAEAVLLRSSETGRFGPVEVV